MPAESRWKKHRQLLEGAAAARDWPAAESALAVMWSEAKARDEALVTCNTHFAEGVLRDKQERYEEAEAAFTQALALDEAAHGKYGAPSTLHSLGLVRENRGNFEGALQSYRASAELIRKSQPFAFARAVSPMVQMLRKLERLDDALALLDEADQICDAQELTPEPDKARLSLLRGETLRLLKSSDAFLHFGAVVIKHSRTKMPPELEAIVGSAWFGIHRVAKEEALRALACWYASKLAHENLRRTASDVLSSLPARGCCQGDPAQPRIAFTRPAFLFVASTQLGLVKADVATDAKPGDPVVLEWNDEDQITSVRRAPP